MDTNVTGTLRACQIFGKHMLERGYGRIVNIASLNTFVLLKEVTAYAASKAAVGALTKSLAVRVEPHGSHGECHRPGVFRTALNQKLLDESDRGKELLMRTPMGRFGKTEELVGVGDLSWQRCLDVCYRRDSGGRWRIPGQRRQSVGCGRPLS